MKVLLDDGVAITIIGGQAGGYSIAGSQTHYTATGKEECSSKSLIDLVRNAIKKANPKLPNNILNNLDLSMKMPSSNNTITINGLKAKMPYFKSRHSYPH